MYCSSLHVTIGEGFINIDNEEETQIHEADKRKKLAIILSFIMVSMLTSCSIYVLLHLLPSGLCQYPNYGATNHTLN